ncbi:MAG: hypothetical protein P8L20_07485 [Flavobacteriales bacterium]|nr:hypothetical protein [Flavobacteriales bacterium]
MKNIKYLLIFISFGMLIQSFSQDSIGKLSFETRYQLRQDSAYVPNLNIRYFFADNSALRVGLAYQYSSILREIKEVDGDGVGTVEKLNDLFAFNIGFEKHFRKNNVSPYLGVELQFGFGKNEEYGSRTDSIIFIADYNYSIKKPISQFGVHVFSGVDFYVFDNLYVGTELGILFSSIYFKTGEYKITDESSLTEPEIITSIASVKTKTFGVANVGMIKVGWRF